ncbi:MAG: hypothetical protein ACFFER_17585 [Candidatus Thorarchaeota archaeon]
MTIILSPGSKAENAVHLTFAVILGLFFFRIFRPEIFLDLRGSISAAIVSASLIGVAFFYTKPERAVDFLLKKHVLKTQRGRIERFLVLKRLSYVIWQRMIANQDDLISDECENIIASAVNGPELHFEKWMLHGGLYFIIGSFLGMVSLGASLELALIISILIDAVIAVSLILSFWGFSERWANVALFRSIQDTHSIARLESHQRGELMTPELIPSVPVLDNESIIWTPTMPIMAESITQEINEIESILKLHDWNRFDRRFIHILKALPFIPISADADIQVEELVAYLFETITEAYCQKQDEECRRLWNQARRIADTINEQLSRKDWYSRYKDSKYERNTIDGLVKQSTIIWNTHDLKMHPVLYLLMYHRELFYHQSLFKLEYALDGPTDSRSLYIRNLTDSLVSVSCTMTHVPKRARLDEFELHLILEMYKQGEMELAVPLVFHSLFNLNSDGIIAWEVYDAIGRNADAIAKRLADCIDARLHNVISVLISVHSYGATVLLDHIVRQIGNRFRPECLEISGGASSFLAQYIAKRYAKSKYIPASIFVLYLEILRQSMEWELSNIEELLGDGRSEEDVLRIHLFIRRILTVIEESEKELDALKGMAEGMLKPWIDNGTLLRFAKRMRSHLIEMYDIEKMSEDDELQTFDQKESLKTIEIIDRVIPRIEERYTNS